jgi:hypothetical protein
VSELPKCYSQSAPVARKQHICCECRGVIEKGESYHLFSGVWDRPQRYKTCADCQTLRNEICSHIQDSEDYPYFGGLYQDVFEFRDNGDWPERFNAIRAKRNAPESPKRWMEEWGKEDQP